MLVLKVSIPCILYPIETLIEDFMIGIVVFPLNDIIRYPIITCPTVIMSLKNELSCFRVCNGIFFNADPHRVS